MKKLISWISKNRNAFTWLVFIGYTIFSIAFSIRYWKSFDNGGYFSENQIRPNFAVLAFIIQSLGFTFSIFIWRNILGSYNLKTNYWQDFKRCGYGLLTIMLPGKVFYHLGRITLYFKDGIKGKVVGIAGISETLVVGIASLFLYGFCYLLDPGVNLLTNIWLTIIIALISIFLLVPFTFRKLVIFANHSGDEINQQKPVNYSFFKGLSWVLGEIVVVSIGGVSLYLFISGFYKLEINNLLIIIAVWAAAAASSSFLFWLPGSFLVRDGAMLLVLQKIIPNLEQAYSIIVFHRLWIIISNFIFVFFIWLIFDFPRFLRNER